LRNVRHETSKQKEDIKRSERTQEIIKNKKYISKINSTLQKEHEIE
jgi:hypothetical protein